jgi:hypothetical protein
MQHGRELERGIAQCLCRDANAIGDRIRTEYDTGERLIVSLGERHELVKAALDSPRGVVPSLGVKKDG